MANVLGVIGGSGGVGSSTFATLLAAAAGPSALVDADPVGGGIDVLLGIEAVRGARWSGVRLDGGYLDPAALRAGLPTAGSVAVLAADVGPPSADAAVQVVGAAAQVGRVVVDLPRGPGAVRDALLGECSLVIVVAEAAVRELAAARAVIGSVLDCAPGRPVGVVLRRGAVAADEAIARLGAPLLGVLPALDRSVGTGAAARVAGGVLDGVSAGVRR